MATPLEMPNPLPVNAKAFDINYVQDVSPVGQGFIQAIERTTPRWVAQYETPVLTGLREQNFQAFLDELEGSVGSFLGFDPRRPRPYHNLGTGGHPWEASPGVPARVTATNYTDSAILLDRVANGFIMVPGDYVAFQKGNAWYLYRVTVANTASGNIINLIVKPRPITVSVPTEARLDRPCAAMKIVGRVSKKDNLSDGGAKYSFQAVQFIDRTV